MLTRSVRCLLLLMACCIVGHSVFLKAQTSNKDEVQKARTEATPALAQLSADDKADMAYVRKLPRRTTSGVLDLSDPPQYRYLMKQWALAGITQERHPQLFKSVEALRAKHTQERTKMNAAKPLNAERDLSPVSTVEYPIVPVNIITSLAQVSPGVFAATAFTSVPGDLQLPATEAVTTMALYDQNDNLLSPVTTANQYAAGYDMANTTVGTVPQGTTILYASGTYYYIDNQGVPHSGSLNALITPYPAGAVVNNPMTGSLIMNSQQPKDVENNGVIKVCIIRADADCDYKYQAVNGQQIVQFPIQATFTVPEALQPLPNQQANGMIQITVSQPNAAQGGTCTLPANFNFWNPTPPNTISIQGSVISWLFNPGPFSNPVNAPTVPCFPSNSTVVYSLQITVLATNPQTGGTDYFMGSVLTRGNPPPPPPGTAYLPPMVVAYGCLAEGTRVTMADGSWKNIEKVGVADRVLPAVAGGPQNVRSFTRGVELKPMIRLVTANGRDLLLTETHPVMTDAGIKMAKQLKAGDMVQTDAGTSALQAVTREMFNGTVWNLNVDAGEKNAAKDATTFFANGILVGDGNIQHELELAEREQPRNVLQVLPQEWHEDYLNALADGTITSTKPTN